MEYYQITKYTHTKTWKWHTFFMFLGNMYCLINIKSIGLCTPKCTPF